MVVHVPCEKYPQTPYCVCENHGETDNEHYKLFDLGAQKYLCCDSLKSISLRDLNNYNDPPAEIQWSSPCDFFKNLEDKNITGCCFTKFCVGTTSPGQDDYLTKNYQPLIDSANIVTALYNHFIYDKPVPEVNSTNITCSSGFVPFILSYKSPQDIYYNSQYICNENTNSVFEVLYANNKRIDYHINRFFNTVTKQPCITSTCPGLTGDIASVYNQGNQSPVYSNTSQGDKTSSIISISFAVLLLVVFFIIMIRSLNNFS